MALTLMAVHAHPDDEAIGTGGVLARAASEGIRTVVVTCTNGEFGDGPGGVKPGEEGHDPAAVAATRRAELERAITALGVAHLEMLGYHDSGMVDWAYKSRGDVFANVPDEVAVARLVGLLDSYRPQVVISYEEAAAYDHPDHVKTARITRLAAEQSGIPRKRYETSMSTRGWEKLAALLKEEGVEMPFEPSPEWLAKMAESEAKITTVVDVSAFLEAKRAAVMAHASQMNQSFVSKLPARAYELAFAQEYFIRAFDTTGASIPETDLFAGLR
ncbi:MAG TPA: PIG-L family deacetylase [Actinomycetota bacterium]|nr:PIG-L family deacetylase [Actinomycetota bacterium]